MQLWLRDYEDRRFNSGQPSQPSEFWTSSKFDTQNMTWREVSEIFVPELNMTWGAAINSLRKFWKSYKISGRTGEPRSYAAWQINQIQDSLGIQKSTFPELEGIDPDEQVQASDEYWGEESCDLDRQLRREELEDAANARR